MNTSSLLTALGLSHIESKIYLALLRGHRSSIAGIAQDTDIHRPTIYRVIPRLIETGLVSEVKVGKRSLYIAENPAKLRTLAQTLTSQLEENLPDLERMYDGSQQRPFIRYYEGKKAIQNIYEDMIQRSKKGDSIYRYESPRDLRIISKYYPKLYWQRSTGPQGEIEKYVITNEATRSKRQERIWRHTKAIPEQYDAFDYNITQLIYKDTVAFIDFDTETATLIQNKRFADFQLRIFKMLFKKL